MALAMKASPPRNLQIRRLKGQIATTQSFRMHPSQGVSPIIGEIRLTIGGFDRFEDFLYWYQQ